MTDTPDDERKSAAKKAPGRRPSSHLTEDILLARLEQAQKHLCLPPAVWSILVDVICPDDDVDKGGQPLPRPTRTLPGTDARIKVLTARAEAGQQLFHPDDLVFDDSEETDRLGVLIKRLRTGVESRVSEPVVRQDHRGVVRTREEGVLMPLADATLQPTEELTVAALVRLVRRVIAGTEKGDDLREILERQRREVPEVARALGVDIRALRAGGGTFLRAFMQWVRKQRRSRSVTPSD